jgi:hypothetical protein
MARRRMGEWMYRFFTSSLVGGEWSASRLGRFTPGDRAPGTHWIGGWVGPRRGLDDVERRRILHLPRPELRPLGRPVRSQSLYRLRYLGDELERTCEETVWPNRDTTPVMMMLKRITKDLIQDSLCPDRDSKWSHCQYKSRALPLRQPAHWNLRRSSVY